MTGNPKKLMIGAFALGALILALGAIIAFGPGLLFTQTLRCIMFFPNSVSGLRVGSPVLFRGVPLGSVKEISIEADAARLHFSIPVVVELLGGKVQLNMSQAEDSSETLYEARKVSPETLLRQLIAKGLRAQLVTMSFVTGQLAVSLELLPDAPQRLVGNTDLVEIPTVASTFEKLEKTISQLPLQELVDRLINAITGIEHLVNSPEMTRVPASVDATLDAASTSVEEIRRKVGPLADDLDRSLADYTALAGHLEERVDNLAGKAAKTFGSLDARLKEARNALGNFQKVLNADSPTIAELNRALRELAKVANTIREYTELLQRRPEALIKGKGAPGR